MALDLSPFRRAVGQLTAGLAAAQAAPDDELRRNGAIQRFKYTYEAGHQALRRCLEETEPAPGQVRVLSFPDLIGLGAERGLPVGDRDIWKVHQGARAMTDRAYDGAVASEVFARIPAFLDDAQVLLGALESRPSEP